MSGRMDLDEVRTQLLDAIAAAYHASQALLRVQARHGADSPETVAARAQVQQAKAELVARQRAYHQAWTTTILQEAPRRRRTRTTDPPSNDTPSQAGQYPPTAG